MAVATPIAPYDVDSEQSGFTRFVLRHEARLLPLGAMIVFLLIWQEIVDLNMINKLWVAPPTATFSELVWLFHQHFFFVDLGTSGEELVIGLGISIVVGVIGGIIYGWYRPVREALGPLLHGYNAMPHIALVPVIILIFGIGIWSKVTMIVLIDVTTFWLSIATGIEHLDHKYIRLARSFGASDLKLFRTVALPATFPHMVSAMRLGVGRALIAIVVAELYGSQAGIGHLLTVTAQNFETSQMYAALVVITAIGILFNVGLRKVENWYSAWRV